MRNLTHVPKLRRVDLTPKSATVLPVRGPVRVTSDLAPTAKPIVSVSPTGPLPSTEGVR